NITTPFRAFINTTAATVTITLSLHAALPSCVGASFTASVLVNPAPVASATPLSQTICSGGTIPSLTLNTSISGTTYSWTRNNTGSVTDISASETGNITLALRALNNTTAAPVT